MQSRGMGDRLWEHGIASLPNLVIMERDIILRTYRMLLSWPTWIIHLFTVTEWAVAMGLFWRYGRLIQRRELQIFAVCMGPHLISGLLILGFHLSGDTARGLLEVSRLTNFGGSLLLLVATLMMVPTLGRWQRCVWGIVPLGLVWVALVHWPLLGEHSMAVLRAANIAYLSFLLSLLWVYHADRRLFSLLTIGGFWFLLVFVAVTLFTTRIATVDLGLPSLSQADVLHGLSESLLSITNLLVALGVYRQIGRFEYFACQIRATRL